MSVHELALLRILLIVITSVFVEFAELCVVRDEEVKHGFTQFRNVILVFPSPVRLGSRIVKTLRPTLGCNKKHNTAITKIHTTYSYNTRDIILHFLDTANVVQM